MLADQSLRVLYSFPHPLDRPGVATTALNQVRSLAQRGINVELYCTSLGEAQLPSSVDVNETMTFIGRRVPHRAIGVQNAYHRHDRIVARRLRRGRRPDIVHAWPRACLVTLSEARRQGITALRECPNPHIASVYRESAAAVEAAGVPLSIGHSHRFSKRVAKLEVEEFLAANALLVPSAYAANEFVAEGFPPNRILRHRYGCDIDRFHPTEGVLTGDTPFRATFLGRGDPTKGLHIALQAWAQADLAPTSLLKVAGSIDRVYADSLSHLCVDETVQFLGFTSDAPQLLRDSDVLLLPSWTEGSALVTYEAQASGCLPLVSRATGAFGGDGVDFLSHEVGNAAELANQLSLLSGNPQQMLRFRSSLLADRQRFSWTSAANVLEECYLAALRRA